MNMKHLLALRHALATVAVCGAAFGGEHRARADDVAGGGVAVRGLPNRAETLHRQRRIILNDDNASIHKEEATTAEGYLGYRLTETVDTQMDSIWLSVVTGPNALLYDAKVGEPAGKEFYELYPPSAEPKEDIPFGANYTKVWHRIKLLRDAGADPLKLAVDFGHQHGKEVFASIRMNMINDSWHGPDFCTRFKREHPEYCLGVRGTYPKTDHRYLYWSAFDYAQKPVRDLRVGMIDDICTRYDVDGIELDFFRWPMLFKPTLDNKPVETRHIKIMSDFFRRIRKRMMEIEVQRRRPLLLAARVFDSPESCLKLGLDVSTLLEEGLIDILVVGSDYNHYSIPAVRWVKEAHRHGVLFYVGMYRSRGLEQDRALASYYHSCGVDGIYTFNFKFPKSLVGIKEGGKFINCLPTINEIGDPGLRTKYKHYVMSGSGSASRNHACTPAIVPVSLKANTSRPCLLIGDDVEKAQSEGLLKELKLSLSLDRTLTAADQITFKLNDTVVSDPQWGERNVVFRLAAPPLRKGANTLAADFGEGAAHSEISVTDIQLWVRYQ